MFRGYHCSRLRCMERSATNNKYSTSVKWYSVIIWLALNWLAVICLVANFVSCASRSFKWTSTSKYWFRRWGWPGHCPTQNHGMSHWSLNACTGWYRQIANSTPKDGFFCKRKLEFSRHLTWFSHIDISWHITWTWLPSGLHSTRPVPYIYKFEDGDQAWHSGLRRHRPDGRLRFILQELWLCHPVWHQDKEWNGRSASENALRRAAAALLKLQHFWAPTVHLPRLEAMIFRQSLKGRCPQMSSVASGALLSSKTRLRGLAAADCDAERSGSFVPRCTKMVNESRFKCYTAIL